MKGSLICASALLVAGCSGEQQREEELLMDRVEARVQLPAEALPLREYARYYAWNGDGEVSAVYISHYDAEFEQAKKICSKEDVKAFPCGPKLGSLAIIPNGQRTWVEGPQYFPGMAGGGCGMVRFSYNVQTGRPGALECNGPY